jgi:hypothetical protein
MGVIARLEGTYAFDLASDPIDEVKCLVAAKERPMGQEDDEVVPHDFYEGLKRWMLLSFEFWPNDRDGGGLMARASCEVQKADFQTSLSSFEAKNACEKGIRVSIRNTPHDIAETANKS